MYVVFVNRYVLTKFITSYYVYASIHARDGPRNVQGVRSGTVVLIVVDGS